MPVDENRLVIDEAVSSRSLCIKGTKITADHIFQLVRGGWSWPEIIAEYPEVTEDDIRACLVLYVL